MSSPNSCERRRDALASAVEEILREDFDKRILPFDSAAAHAYAMIAAARRAAGHTASPSDCQIAAIAKSNRMAVATRNVRDFDDMGIKLFDPWAGS